MVQVFSKTQILNAEHSVAEHVGPSNKILEK